MFQGGGLKDEEGPKSTVVEGAEEKPTEVSRATRASEKAVHGQGGAIRRGSHYPPWYPPPPCLHPTHLEGQQGTESSHGGPEQ